MMLGTRGYTIHIQHECTLYTQCYVHMARPACIYMFCIYKCTCDGVCCTATYWFGFRLNQTLSLLSLLFPLPVCVCVCMCVCVCVCVCVEHKMCPIVPPNKVRTWNKNSLPTFMWERLMADQQQTVPLALGTLSYMYMYMYFSPHMTWCTWHV